MPLQDERWGKEGREGRPAARREVHDDKDSDDDFFLIKLIIKLLIICMGQTA